MFCEEYGDTDGERALERIKVLENALIELVKIIKPQLFKEGKCSCDCVKIGDKGYFINPEETTKGILRGIEKRGNKTYYKFVPFNSGEGKWFENFKKEA